MKTFTKVATLALVLGTSSLIASSDDYALTDNYKLLNDMNLAKKQQSLIIDMSQALESDLVDTNLLNTSKERFSQVLIGLSNGNRAINLKGTNIPTIKAKLSEVQKLWKTELKVLNSAITNEADKDKAITGLNNIMIKMSQAVSLYNKSYSKFKQRSRLSSIVNRHINGRQNQTFAFNIVE